MSGAHALIRTPRLAPRVVALGCELVLLGFVGVVSYMAALYIDWSSAPCATPSARLLVAGGAILVAAVRRLLPVTALLAASVLFGLYPATGVTVALAAYGVAGRAWSVRRRAVGLIVAAFVPFTIALVGSGYQWRVSFIVFGVAALVCLAGPVAVQMLLGQRERLIGALRDQTRYAASAARLQERSRIAQEMHDLLGHRLSLISLYAGSLEVDATKPSHETEPARLIRGTARTAMDELRATLGMLRQREPAATKPADCTGTWSDVAELVRQAQAGGIHVELHWSGADLVGVGQPIRQAVHRIVREGLTNVYRHAPGSTASVFVEHGQRSIHVGVFDDGRVGIGTPGTGLGLVGVQERVRLLGGSFLAGALPGQGFRVAAELPLAIAPPAPVEPDTDSEPADNRWARAGMSAVLATGLIGAVAILVVTFNSVTFNAPPELVGAPRVGSTRAEVTDYIGRDDVLARQAARGLETNPPQGADCMYTYFSTEDGTIMIERYCFRQDILVDKARFGVPA
ncbi:signal transduction histidine kinase [Kibdelosporangium banguiense]|uniref:histidine kinase n=1 Tax=Kibdelosporangium banguiense TaxID=1365924 RepID=A0ABS4U2Q0_9PSEU|nr:histidine kinase [Kibdelosporangium banguiense]MBP2330461.1 signal transduction histidine kinase [Kibdelosporangium banguiense]